MTPEFHVFLKKIILHEYGRPHENIFVKTFRFFGQSPNVVVIPDKAIVTKNGDYVVLTTDGNYILTVDAFVPANTIRTINGNPVITKNNQFITI